MRPRWGPKNSRSPGLGSSPLGRASVAPNWSPASRGSETPCSASTCCVNAEQSNPSGVRPPQRYGTPSSRRTLSSIDGRHPIGTIARDSTQPRRPSGSSTVRYPPRARPATSRAFRTTGLTDAPPRARSRTSANATATRARARRTHSAAPRPPTRTTPQDRTQPRYRSVRFSTHNHRPPEREARIRTTSPIRSWLVSSLL